MVNSRFQNISLEKLKKHFQFFSPINQGWQAAKRPSSRRYERGQNDPEADDRREELLLLWPQQGHCRLRHRPRLLFTCSRCSCLAQALESIIYHRSGQWLVKILVESLSNRNQSNSFYI